MQRLEHGTEMLGQDAFGGLGSDGFGRDVAQKDGAFELVGVGADSR